MYKIPSLSTSCGATCRFYKLDGVPNDPNRMGLKTYDDPDTRDQAHEDQHTFWKAGLAPPVGSRVEVECPFNLQIYGLLTGIAVVTTDHNWDRRIQWWCQRLGLPIPTDASENSDVWAGIERDFLDSVADQGFDQYDFEWLGDIHSCNLGLWMDKLVLIDFT